ncbi:MAG: winged helix-turn-helix domain-containing protein [Gemmatimonadota bacterium]
MTQSRTNGNWTFLSNHSHVLICIVGDPTMRMRDLATRVGITERAVQRIVSDLRDAGYLTPERRGRRNHYHVNLRLPMRHPVEGHCLVSELLEALQDD